MENKQNFSTAVWNANISTPSYPQLDGDLEADVVVVGVASQELPPHTS